MKYESNNNPEEITARYVDRKTVAKYTSLGESTIYEWASQGKIPSIKIGRRILFDLEDIDKLMASLKRTDSHKKAIDKIIGEIIDNGYNSIR